MQLLLTRQTKRTACWTWYGAGVHNKTGVYIESKSWEGISIFYCFVGPLWTVTVACFFQTHRKIFWQILLEDLKWNIAFSVIMDILVTNILIFVSSLYYYCHASAFKGQKNPTLGCLLFVSVFVFPCFSFPSVLPSVFCSDFWFCFVFSSFVFQFSPFHCCVIGETIW